jgi:hypothetical protein
VEAAASGPGGNTAEYYIDDVARRKLPAERLDVIGSLDRRIDDVDSIGDGERAEKPLAAGVEIFLVAAVLIQRSGEEQGTT